MGRFAPLAGLKGGPTRSRLHAWLGRPIWPAASLLAAAIIMPALLFGLAAWQTYAGAMVEARAHAERTARTLEEHAAKVFETHRMAIQSVADHLAYDDVFRPGGVEALHRVLVALQQSLDQIVTVTVVDMDGRLLASGRTPTNAARIDFSDRDWFRGLKDAPAKKIFVSRSYVGRQSGVAIFNFAEKVKVGAREAIVAVSVDRSYFEDFYREVEPLDHAVVLVRLDGAVLAAYPKTDRSTLPASSRLRREILHAASGYFMGVSSLDGVERNSAFRQVGHYPVFVRFGLSTEAILAPWRQSLFSYGLLALFCSLGLVGVSLVAVRITERERQARTRLETAVAALAAEAEERRQVEEQLRQSQKMEAVGRLANGIAHDFNNLLTVIMGSLEMAAKYPDNPDRVKRHVGAALDGATRATSLTERLLSFSRKRPLATEEVDVRGVVAGMLELVGRTIGRDVAIVAQLEGDPWRARTDTGQLENVLLNLAVNARDAMPKGGTLTVSASNLAVPFGSDVPPGEYVALSVADTGIGMAPDVMAKVFDPFFTTKPAGKGTGLGLSQVYAFAEQSGGHARVASTLGVGSRFVVYLPRIEKAAETPTRAADAVVEGVPTAHAASVGLHGAE